MPRNGGDAGREFDKIEGFDHIVSFACRPADDR